jgi:hypothetical protein
VNFARAYLLAVVPILAVVVAAVWPPRLWAVALIAAGPLITLAAVLGIPPFEFLGWLPSLGVPYAVLTIPPLIPWRRLWAARAVPGVALTVWIIFIALGHNAPAAFICGPPALAALVALVLALARRPYRPEPEPAG